MYGVPLTDVLSGRMSWQELDALVTGLPMESAYKTVIRDSFTDQELADIYAANPSEKHGPWSKLELLMTQLIWQMQQLLYVQLVANGAKNVPSPEPIPVPGHVRAGVRVSDDDVIWLDEIRERNRRAREAG